ncbi:MAG: CHAD domain-containing protein, partial [Candidatus Poribacteria bacterium]|nr:CHAD domain-containing protein [Candidatus Poribacteria bacterium]
REDSDSIYQELPAIKQLHALRIAAIVRVADGLDYTQDQSAEPTYFDGTRKRGRLFVKGEGSEVNVARANEKADLWGRAMPRPLAFTVDKGFQYYLRRGDRMQAAAYKLFRRFYDEAMTHEDGVRAGADVEELHDFRVAIRRLRASMKAFQPSLGGELLKPIRDELRFIQQETNAARDLDVLIEALKELPSSEGATTLLEQIRNDRQRAREAVESLLNGVTYRHFKANFPVFLEETLHPVAHPLDEKAASKRARNVAPELLTTLLSEVLSYRDALATGDDEEAMHALRIACKRFRYAADFFGELLNTEHGFLIDQLKAMQDSLGDLRDADVRGAYFEAFDREHRNRFAKEEQRSLAAIFEGRACDLPEEEERALLSLIDENRAQRRNALDTFHTQWRVFASDEFQQRIAGTFKINLESMPATTTE